MFAKVISLSERKELFNGFFSCCWKQEEWRLRHQRIDWLLLGNAERRKRKRKEHVIIFLFTVLSIDKNQSKNYYYKQIEYESYWKIAKCFHDFIIFNI